MLAIVFGVNKARHYLLDSHFIVWTDHESLIHVLRIRNPSGRLARWLVALQEYSFTLVYRKGKLNVPADATTRLEFAQPDEILLVLKGVDFAAVPWEGRPAPLQARLQPQQVSVLAFTRASAARSQSVVVSEPEQRIVREGTQVEGQPQGDSTPASAGSTMGVDQTTPFSGGSALPEGHPATQRVTTPLRESPAASESSARVAAPLSDLPAQAAGWSGPVGRLKPWVFHEEVWLATGVHQLLRGRQFPDAASAAGEVPSRFALRIRKMAEEYRAVFSTEYAFPLAIFTVQGKHPQCMDRACEVPAPSQRINIVAAAHELGHFGVSSTLNRIKESGVWWLGLKADVELIVSRCAACARDNKHPLRWHPAQSIGPPAASMDRVHIDLLQLPTSAEGFSYLFVLVCALSKFPISIPLSSKEAREVAEAFWHIITLFGAPGLLVSDNGPEFVNWLLKALLELHGISRRLITAYRPQANGQVERYNRTILSVLLKLAGNTPQLWPQWLDFVMLVLRTAVHRSTKFTPFQLMFGRPWNPLRDFHQMVIHWEFDQSRYSPAVDEEIAGAVAARARLMRQQLDWADGAGPYPAAY